MTESGFYILFCLQDPQHGYGISQQVKRMTGGEVTISAGTMYGTLSKMEKDGLIRFFREEKNVTFVERLEKAGLQMTLSEEQLTLHSNRLEGQSIVISGVFQHHSRDEYKALIEQHGGKNTGSISAKTTFVLAGDNMGPAKLEKAQKLGVLIVSEEEFLQMIK
jgi:NAD-dependent DNA ligase